MKETRSDKVLNIINVIICGLLALITVYPLIYVFSMSISDLNAVVSNSVVLFPKGISFKAFGIVMKNMEI